MDVIRGFAHRLQRQNLAASQDPLSHTFGHEYDFQQLRDRLESYIDRRKIPPRQNTILTSTIDWTGLLLPDDENFIGGGSFGDVFFGKWKKVQNTTLPEVVIKVIRAPPVNSRQAETRSRQLQREITVWHRLHHPNIVPFIGIAFTRGDYPSLISLWMPNGTIRQYLSDNPGISRMGLIKGVGNGLAYLHAFHPPITHGDLKGDNVLVNKDGVPCLVDFGLSRMMEDQTLWATSATTAPGTTRWKAPELMCGDQPTVTMESDVYAFGMTCVEIVTNTSPYPLYRNDAAVVTAVIVRGERPARPSVADVDDKRWHLWTACWDSDPSKRPSMHSVMSDLDFLDMLSAVTANMSIERLSRERLRMYDFGGTARPPPISDDDPPPAPTSPYPPNGTTLMRRNAIYYPNSEPQNLAQFFADHPSRTGAPGYDGISDEATPTSPWASGGGTNTFQSDIASTMAVRDKELAYQPSPWHLNEDVEGQHTVDREMLITPFFYNRDEPMPDPSPGSKRAIMQRQQRVSSRIPGESVPEYTPWWNSESLRAWPDSRSTLGLPEYEEVRGNPEDAELPPYSSTSPY